jgi:hypothetical protein
MPDSDKPAPNQTIQLDALDPVEAEKITVGPRPSAPPSEGAPSRRKIPPPLPASALVSNPPEPEPPAYVSRAPSAPPPPEKSTPKAAVIAVFAVLVVAAIAGGIYVGNSARSHLAPQAATRATAAIAPAASASDSVLMLPTIEMSSQPASAGSASAP